MEGTRDYCHTWLLYIKWITMKLPIMIDWQKCWKSDNEFNLFKYCRLDIINDLNLILLYLSEHNVIVKLALRYFWCPMIEANLSFWFFWFKPFLVIIYFSGWCFPVFIARGSTPSLFLFFGTKIKWITVIQKSQLFAKAVFNIIYMTIFFTISMYSIIQANSWNLVLTDSDVLSLLMLFSHLWHSLSPFLIVIT